MKTVKTTTAKSNAKTTAAVAAVMLDVAKTARELKIAETQIKTFRAFCRKQSEYNKIRKQKFAHDSAEHKIAVSLCNAFLARVKTAAA